MSIEFLIQHDPRRGHLLPALIKGVPYAKIIPDPGADLPTRSPWRCYLACLEAGSPELSHTCILQDDVECAPDFAKAVALVARRHPSAPVALFAPGIGSQRRAILQGCADGKRYVQLPHQNTFVPVVCVLWPRACVESILAWWDTAKLPATMTADDGVLGKWMEATGARVLATVPSLVEHPDHERSLVGKMSLGGRNPARVAACWWGPEGSPLELTDW